MKLFTNNKADYTVIVGCGHLGSNLANALSDEGRNVLVIDRNKDSFSKLVVPSFYLGLITLIGDATLRTGTH
ncbi:MAG: NAD-binding protein [Dehalobacterium sp.]